MWFFAFRKSSVISILKANYRRILNLIAVVFIFGKYVSVLRNFYGVRTNYSTDIDFSVSESIFSYYFEPILYFPALILFSSMFTYINVSPQLTR